MNPTYSDSGGFNKTNSPYPDENISNQETLRSSKNVSLPIDVSKGVYDPSTNSVIIPVLGNDSNLQQNNNYSDIHPEPLPPPPPTTNQHINNDENNNLVFDFGNMGAQGLAFRSGGATAIDGGGFSDDSISSISRNDNEKPKRKSLKSNKDTSHGGKNSDEGKVDVKKKRIHSGYERRNKLKSPEKGRRKKINRSPSLDSASGNSKSSENNGSVSSGDKSTGESQEPKKMKASKSAQTKKVVVEKKEINHLAKHLLQKKKEETESSNYNNDKKSPSPEEASIIEECKSGNKSTGTHDYQYKSPSPEEASIIEECKTNQPSPTKCVSPEEEQSKKQKKPKRSSNSTSNRKLRIKRGDNKVQNKKSSENKAIIAKNTTKKTTKQTSKSTLDTTSHGASTVTTTQTTDERRDKDRGQHWSKSGYTPKDSLVFFSEDIHPSNVNKKMDEMIKNYYSIFKRNQVEYEEHPEESLSLIQPISETGSMLDVYPGTHKCARDSFVLHKYMCVRLKIPRTCCVIFSSDLIHNGTVSRTKKKCSKKQEEDLRFFYYLQKESNIPTSDGINNNSLRSATSVSPDPLLNPKVKNVCPRLESGAHCTHCADQCVFGDKVCDMHNIEFELFIQLKDSGDIIIGDLEKYGFIVVKSLQCTSDIMHVIGNRKTFGGGKLTSLNKEPNRKLLFEPLRTDITVHQRNYDECPIHRHIRLVHDNIVTLAVGPHYKILKPNVIFNAGKIEQDQFPHWDFPERKIKESKNDNKK